MSFAVGLLVVAWFFPAVAAIEVALSSSGRAVGMGSSLPHSAEEVVKVPPGVSVASEDSSEASPESPSWMASDRARRQEMRGLIREASDAGCQYSAATQEGGIRGLASLPSKRLPSLPQRGKRRRSVRRPGPPTSTQQVGRYTGSPETLSLFRFLPDFAERDSAQFQA